MKTSFGLLSGARPFAVHRPIKNKPVTKAAYR
jgi:hypothetical protein